MGDSHNWKPGARPGASPSAASPSAAGAKPAAVQSASPAGADSGAKTGRVVHDERGNAVWDWVKDTARIAVDSTSRLLRKLEVPELQVEDTNEQELRFESDRDAGGGYNPYGGSGAASTNSGSARGTGGGYDPYAGSGKAVARANGGSARGTGAGNPGNARSGNVDLGGGYDPYGKSLTNKTTRKR